jgi:maltodextrin utilization protein YvdJ
MQRARRKRQERALNQQRNLISTTAQLLYSDTSKTTLKITSKNGQAKNDKRRHKNLTADVAVG